MCIAIALFTAAALTATPTPRTGPEQEKANTSSAPAAAPARTPQSAPEATGETPDVEGGPAVQRAGGREKLEGEKCQAPTFTFEWVDFDAGNIIVTADPKGQFDLLVWDPVDDQGLLHACLPSAERHDNQGRSEGPFEQLRRNLGAPDPQGKLRGGGDDTRARGRKQETLFEVRTDATGVLVHLEGFKLLDAKGRVCVAYRATPSPSGPAPCPERKDGVATLQVVERHRFAVDVGSSFGLNGDGSWKTSFEMAVNATSRWNSWLYGAIDVRYASLAAVQQDKSQQSSGQQGGGQSSGSATQFNPFSSGGGTLNAEAKTLVSPGAKQWANPWYAVVLGVGLRTVPTSGSATPSTPAEATTPTSSSQTSVDARGRFLAGFRLQAMGYNPGKPAESFGGARGYFEVGYARDRFWMVEAAPGATGSFDQRDRLYVEAQVEVPKFGGPYARILARARVDKPIKTSSGPSEVRISVLASINTGLFNCVFAGKCTPTPSSTTEAAGQ